MLSFTFTLTVPVCREEGARTVHKHSSYRTFYTQANVPLDLYLLHKTSPTPRKPRIAASMPAIDLLSRTSTLSARAAPTHHPRDWPLTWVLTVVGIILFIELVLAIVWIRVHNLRSKARWASLRQRGVVIVSGAALLWTEDLPLKPYVSHLNLRQIVEKQERDREAMLKAV